MANTKDKIQTPSVYGGAYDKQINDLYNQYSNRGDFSYDVNEDALYQQYKDQYTRNAQRSMKDTMGQATSLTGGYGSSYAQNVGQQAYDRTMQELNDKVPELEQLAYGRWTDQGQDILNRYNIANQLGAADQATRQYNQEYADKQIQLAYENLSSAILTSGYEPDASELQASGMTKQQANALRQAWISANPAAAYIQGALSASDYFKLTGQYPPDVLEAQKAAAASGGGGYYKKPTSKKPDKTTTATYGAATSGERGLVTGLTALLKNPSAAQTKANPDKYKTTYGKKG